LKSLLPALTPLLTDGWMFIAMAYPPLLILPNSRPWVGRISALRPTFFVVRAHRRTLHAQVLDLPHAVLLHVVVVIARGQPFRLVAFAHRERDEEVPHCVRTLAVHVDDRVHHHVL